jgi:hypothetical protein
MRPLIITHGFIIATKKMDGIIVARIKEGGGGT